MEQNLKKDGTIDKRYFNKKAGAKKKSEKERAVPVTAYISQAEVDKIGGLPKARAIAKQALTTQ